MNKSREMGAEEIQVMAIKNILSGHDQDIVRSIEDKTLKFLEQFGGNELLIARLIIALKMMEYKSEDIKNGM